MKNFTTYSIYVWLNDQTTKKQEISTFEAWKIAKNLTCKYFGWGTIYEVDWVYTHENWQIVIEKTIKIELITSENIDDFISILKKTFNQESILVKKSMEEINFA